ncbi:CU044_5270 family protein [Nocardiopsis sp. N85]|uniref:CU044_5270 family protein n=1 Tax=Nocardiopsis sp. N85 TaxID=3029400 RepID=UPI00237FD0F1|nr:CU044_5270 family protein [Nocardiopsis sp. N85]MDE3721045.1 CU044_5270 family protein [Nocardiopsis sp. N85]
MNELDHLRTMRSEIPERSPDELALSTGWRPGRRKSRPVRRPRTLPVVLSGVAAVAAAALFLALVVFPGPGTVTVGPATDPSESEVGGSVREVMAPVIEAARSRPVDGDVWHQRLTWAQAWGVGPEDDRYGVYRVYRTEEWSWTGEYDIDTNDFEGEESGLSAQRTNETTWALVDEDHRAAWERDGSPEYWPHDSETGRVEIPTQEEDGEITGPQPGGWGFGLGTVEHPDLRSLPSDPELLEEMLFSVPETEAENSAHQDHLDNEYAVMAENGYADEGARRFSYVSGALSLPYPPEVRAGMYTVLAGLPGVRALGGVTDLSGRDAVGVAYTLSPTARGTFEERILFDSETGGLLSLEQVVVEPAESESDWSEPGDVVGYTLYEEMGWTDDPPF